MVMCESRERRGSRALGEVRIRTEKASRMSATRKENCGLAAKIPSAIFSENNKWTIVELPTFAAKTKTGSLA